MSNDVVIEWEQEKSSAENMATSDENTALKDVDTNVPPRYDHAIQTASLEQAVKKCWQDCSILTTLIDIVHKCNPQLSLQDSESTIDITKNEFWVQRQYIYIIYIYKYM
jgi:hypothetical protein